MSPVPSSRVLLSIASAVTLLAGCAATYTPPVAGPTAQLHIVSADVKSRPLGQPALNLFHAFNDENCTKGEGIGRLAAFGRIGDAEKDISLSAGKRVFIKGVFVGYYTSDVSVAITTLKNYAITTAVSGDRCTNVVSFVPEANRRYAISQTPQTSSCQMTLVEADTGTAPASQIVHPITEGCKAME